MVKLNGHNSNASVRFVCVPRETRLKSPHPRTTSRGCCVRCIRPALRLPYLHVVSLSMFDEQCLSRCCVTCLLFLCVLFWSRSFFSPNQQGGLACYDTLGYEDHHVRLTTLELSFVLCHGTTSAFAPSRAHHACQVCTPNARVPSITSQRQWLLWLGLKSVVICL